MISKEELKTLIDRVCFLTGQTQEAIALELNYGKNYISEMLSPTGKITAKFLQIFHMKYDDVLENPKNEFKYAQPGREQNDGDIGGAMGSDKIMEVILSIVNTQTEILRDMRNEMAREKTQARIETNLKKVFGGLESIGDKQDRAIKQILSDLEQIKGNTSGLSKG